MDCFGFLNVNCEEERELTLPPVIEVV